MLLILPVINASTLPIVVRPKIGNVLQPNISFNYTFTLATDNACSHALYTRNITITTDDQGLGFTELDVPSVYQTPQYLCEYRNGVLRKVHKFGTAFDVIDNLITASKISTNSINTSHILDGTILAEDLAPNSINTIHIINGTITAADLTTDLSLGWANLTSYPSACPTNQFVTTIGDMITCSSVIIQPNSVNSSNIIDGTIVDADISDATDLTLSQRITFALGEVIDNVIDGWIRITGNLNVTQSANIGSELNVSGISSDGTGSIVCIKSDGTLGTCTDDVKKISGKANCNCG